MAFVSVKFIGFLLVSMILYYSVPKKYQWTVLLAASCVFYWINSSWLLAVLLVSVCVTYFCALEIYRINTAGKAELKNKSGLTKQDIAAIRTQTKKKAKRILNLGVAADLGILVFLKYYNFFAETANTAIGKTGITLPYLHLLLPLGISFYTLQALAYMIDIYRGKYEPERNILKFTLFMSFFPQIVQGPIPRFKQFAYQLYDEHEFDYERMVSGCLLILWGFMKKLIIADRLAIPVNMIFDRYNDFTGLVLFGAAAMYGIQVYTDFSGGMDIARGAAQLFGIELELNFRQPYFSTSIEDFWRRWHITLGSWMKDYVFYPLSLSRRFANMSRKARKVFGNSFGKKLPAFIAMFTVYFLVGIWHGADWKYILYGIWNGVFIVSGILLEDTYVKIRRTFRFEDEQFSWHIFRILRTFVLITFGRYFSRADSSIAALRMMKNTFQSWKDLSFITDGFLVKRLGLNTAGWLVLLIAILILFLVDYLHEKGIEIRKEIMCQPLVFRWGIYIFSVILILVFGIYGPAYNAAGFIYEQF